MLTFLFWNMGGELTSDAPSAKVKARNNLLTEILANLTRRHTVDILMVAEWPISLATILTSINAKNPVKFRAPDENSLCERVAIFPRTTIWRMSRRGLPESRYYTVRRVELLPDTREEFLLVVAHLGSKLRKSDASQLAAVPGVNLEIRKAEKKREHQRTVVVGDLNLNPFEDAMVVAEGYNCVMTREIALRENRRVDGVAHPFFYNPMWSCFGDSTHEDFPPGHADHEPPGTCYFKSGESRWHYWNILDQLLLRPALIPKFRHKDLRILTSDGTTQFLDGRGIPDGSRVSDHLPLLFSLNI